MTSPRPSIYFRDYTPGFCFAETPPASESECYYCGSRPAQPEFALDHPDGSEPRDICAECEQAKDEPFNWDGN